jgi:hypothetical protein
LEKPACDYPFFLVKEITTPTTRDTRAKPMIKYITPHIGEDIISPALIIAPLAVSPTRSVISLACACATVYHTSKVVPSPIETFLLSI